MTGPAPYTPMPVIHTIVRKKNHTVGKTVVKTLAAGVATVIAMSYILDKIESKYPTS